MSYTLSEVPLLAELTIEEREEAMARYEVIAPLLATDHPCAEEWQTAAEHGIAPC